MRKSARFARKPSKVYQMCIRAWRVLQLVSQPSGQIRTHPRCGPSSASVQTGRWSLRADQTAWSDVLSIYTPELSALGRFDLFESRCVIARSIFRGTRVGRWLYDPLNYVTGIRPLRCPWLLCNVWFWVGSNLIC